MKTDETDEMNEDALDTQLQAFLEWNRTLGKRRRGDSLSSPKRCKNATTTDEPVDDLVSQNEAGNLLCVLTSHVETLWKWLCTRRFGHGAPGLPSYRCEILVSTLP